jgi:7,8-dihydropterin-6-yl-methyl-4-(beta-D-ribofuranosyl)aminobenzene 5'-phosphate synthase
VERNGARLGVDFGAIASVVLSHGHWDHAGGLTTALALIRERNGGRAVPYYMHPGISGNGAASCQMAQSCPISRSRASRP